MKVKMSTQGLTVHNFQTAPNFEVKDGNEHLVGNLRVSRGAIYWKTKNAQKWTRTSFADFDAFMSALRKEKPASEVSEPITDDTEASVQSFITPVQTSFFERLFRRR